MSQILIIELEQSFQLFDFIEYLILQRFILLCLPQLLKLDYYLRR